MEREPPVTKAVLPSSGSDLVEVVSFIGHSV
jgi:hypothetical protein